MKSPLAHLARVRGVCSAASVSCARAFPSSQRWTSRRMMVGISKLFEETSVATRWELGARSFNGETRRGAGGRLLRECSARGSVRSAAPGRAAGRATATRPLRL